MATVLFSSSSQLMRHRFVIRCPVLSLLPSSVFIQTKQSLPRPIKTAPSLTSTRLFFSPAPILPQLDSDVELEGFREIELEGESSSNAAAAASASASTSASDGLRKVLLSNFREITGKPPSLSVKEKKELASYAHSLGKKLKSQQVGKSGVTDTVVTALVETLEANELLKLKIHGSCPGELDDVVKQLEETTGSVVVGQIGRTVILYRPSLAKLKAEEKRKLAMLLVEERRKRAQRQPISKQSFQSKGAGLERMQYGGGRRGRSRF